MTRICVSALTLAAFAGMATAQTVQFRIVERRGQTNVPTPLDTLTTPSSHNLTNNVLDLAVQARVTGTDVTTNKPWGLGGFSFDAVIAGESDSSGTLNKVSISNPGAGNPADNVGAYPAQGADFSPGGTPPGTQGYSTGFATGSTLGQHGMAFQYCYAAGINPSLAGNINSSSGTFTNTPNNQEIGLVVGNAAGQFLLQGVPGIDVDANRHWTNNPDYDPDGDNNSTTNPSRIFVNAPDGNPDTYSGPAVPSPLAVADVNAASAATYFGAGLNALSSANSFPAPAAGFFDVFRFQYVVTSATQRVLHFTLANAIAQVFSNLLYNNGLWGANNIAFPDSAISVAGLDIPVGVPAPGAVALVGLGGLVAARRRRA